MEINASDDRSGAALCEKIAEAVEFQDVMVRFTLAPLSDCTSAARRAA